MYLAQLELQGFKSFANKTKVKFDSGITAIVGPNGCGKSNIVDALRWVLGEQRPSLLRSAAMTNVIFNGTAAKKALGMAEVSLTIVNNRGVLPTEFSDITMTRRLYRSGESEYLLNSKPCRLRDINDLFMDTGMGPNAYSVIELKMVDEILNDKNNDRRRLFEEAAGITKFKERKKQTLKKLSDTRADLQRMEDILVEVRKKTRSLQAQASRAERARKYQEELEFLDKAVSREEYQNVRSELNPLLERIASASATKEELRNRLHLLEQNEEEAHEALMSKEQVQNQVRRKVDQANSSIQEIRTNIRVSEEKIKAEESVIQRYEQEIYQAENEIRDLRKNLKSNQEELQNAEHALESMRGEHEAAKVSLEESRQQVSRIRSDLDEAGKKHSEATRRINELQNLQVRLESRIENAEEQEHRLHKELSESREKAASFANEKEALESRHDALIAEYEQAGQDLENARNERELLLNRINQLKDEIRGLQSACDAFRSEYELLKSLAESSDAHPAGVQYLKEQRDDFSMLEIVSDVFSSSEAHAAAVEAVLGDAANFVITANDEEAVRAFGLLRKKDKGRVTIIPLDRIFGEDGGFPESGDPDASDTNVASGTDAASGASDASEANALSDAAGASGSGASRTTASGEIALADHISCDPAFNSLKQLFFGNVVLADALGDAVRIASEKNVTAVTADGDVAAQNGFIYSGSSNKNAGVRIGLREKVERRRQQADEKALEVEKATVRLDDLTETYRKFDLQPHQQKVKECSDRLRKHEARTESFQTQSDFYQKNVQDLERRLEELRETTRKAAEERKQITPELEKLAGRLESVVREEVTLKSTLNEKEDALQRSQTRFNDVALRYQNAGNTVSTLKRDIERFESNMQGIRDRLSQRAEQAKSSKNQIIALREQLETADDELREKLVRKEEEEKEYREAEEACARQRGKINLLEENLKDVRRKKDSNQELLYSLELAKSKLEMEQKSINDHIWETYNLTIDQIDILLPEDTDISTARETIFTLKQRLKNIGEVNPLAITEYDEEKQRLDHFEVQINDLESAEEQLIETIQEINRNAQERFNRTFRAIRGNFKTVFNTLFEENDHCDLVMDEKTEDPLEAKIEIIANPRGKRPSVIEQLSGGEKTLTAIALLFAIYLVKPSPFCVMDEVDAPLDDPNILRFTRLLKKFSDDTQFIVITHNKTTMEESEMMYGVTMPEVGISKLVGVRLDDVTV